MQLIQLLFVEIDARGNRRSIFVEKGQNYFSAENLLVLFDNFFLVKEEPASFVGCCVDSYSAGIVIVRQHSISSSW